MQWRVMVELSGGGGAKQVHEVHAGGSVMPGCSAATLGLSLTETKAVLAGLQRHLVQAQAGEGLGDLFINGEHHRDSGEAERSRQGHGDVAPPAIAGGKVCAIVERHRKRPLGDTKPRPSPAPSRRRRERRGELA